MECLEECLGQTKYYQCISCYYFSISHISLSSLNHFLSHVCVCVCKRQKAESTRKSNYRKSVDTSLRNLHAPFFLLL